MGGLGSDVSFSKSLSFLVTLQQVLEFAKANDMNQAKRAILSLLRDHSAPLNLRLTLVSEFVPRLLSKEGEQRVVFDNSVQVYDLLHEIEDLYIYLELHPNELTDSLQQSVELTRFQLAQSLSHSFVEEMLF